MTMLLRNKKNQGEDQNWCVILSPISSELDRKKVAQKISTIFSLSYDEAIDVVSNTPIIILDNLTREVALKLKEFFRAAGAQTLLTNDVFQKRKCYRTVWPEPPNLSFLFDWRALEEKNIPISAPALAPEDTLEEMRAFLSEKPSVQENSAFLKESFPESERTRLLEEVERRRRECLSSQEESRRLKEEIEKTLSKALQAQEHASTAEFEKQLKEKEKEIKELQLLHSNAQEKNEMLKEESRESRTLYEEKLGFTIRENEQWKKKIQELNAALQNFQKEKQSAAELSAREEIKRLKEDSENSSRLLRESFSRSAAEIEQGKSQARQALEKVRILETAKETLEEKLNEQTEQLTQAGEKFQGLVRHRQELESRLQQEKNLREKAEDRKAELEQNEQRFAHELETVSEEARRREARELHLEREIVQIQMACESQEKTIKELQMLCSHAQEKNRMLKEESSESRTLYEEKLGFAVRENDQWKKKVQELNAVLQNFQQNLQKEKQVAAELSARKEMENKRLREDFENSSGLLRESLSHAMAESEQAKRQASQALEKARILETAKETLEEKINEQAEQLTQADEKFQLLVRQEQEFEGRLQHEKNLREKAEGRKAELEQNQKRLAHELETVSEETRRRETRELELEKEIVQIHAACESQEKTIQGHRGLLETRDRELESLRRQLRDVHQHWEQRETVQRRTYLSNQLAEKENQLKRMVQDQEKIENAIRAREESMRKILAEQEMLEKEIIEAKQAQRHLAEQTKRERSLKVIKPANGSKDSLELEPAPQEAND